MEDAGKGKKKRFQLIFTLRSWWKRRWFQYVPHVDSIDEPSLIDGWRTEIYSEYRSDVAEGSNPSFGFPPESEKCITLSSSFRSIDASLKSDCEQSVEFTEKFLTEHLNFMRQSTEAHEVEVVYDNDRD
jgi:hypothetical protein